MNGVRTGERAVSGAAEGAGGSGSGDGGAAEGGRPVRQREPKPVEFQADLAVPFDRLALSGQI